MRHQRHWKQSLPAKCCTVTASVNSSNTCPNSQSKKKKKKNTLAQKNLALAFSSKTENHSILYLKYMILFIHWEYIFFPPNKTNRNTNMLPICEEYLNNMLFWWLHKEHTDKLQKVRCSWSTTHKLFQLRLMSSTQILD